MPTLYTTVPGPLGDLLLTSDGDHLTGLLVDAKPPADGTADAGRVLKTASQQLRAYLHGELRDFTLSLQQPGTEFQQRVWAELLSIPYGETISYQELAVRVGKPKASRAVGSANGKNQLCIVVPCHRVIASGGALGGYGGGLWRKEWLLRLERGG